MIRSVDPVGGGGLIHAILAKARRWRLKTLKPQGRGATAGGLRLCLGDRDGAVARALAGAFADAAGVEVVEGDLRDADCAAIVSPANSFGDMGGGIDKAIDDLHGGLAQRAVMAAIADHFLGELPVGMALIVELPGPRFPFVVAAPTMRVPGRVAGTLNAYLAMRAALVAVVRHNAEALATGGRTIPSLVASGLGTGVGGMDPAEAAAQMRAAYDSVLGEGWRHVLHPAMAPYALHR